MICAKICSSSDTENRIFLSTNEFLIKWIPLQKFSVHHLVITWKFHAGTHKSNSCDSAVNRLFLPYQLENSFLHVSTDSNFVPKLNWNFNNSHSFCILYHSIMINQLKIKSIRWIWNFFYTHSIQLTQYLVRRDRLTWCHISRTPNITRKPVSNKCFQQSKFNVKINIKFI